MDQPSMDQLRLVAVRGDGESLELADGRDRRFLLPIDASVRAAVRDARPAARRPAPPAATEAGSEEDDSPKGPLRPRDIQARIRAGATPQELAEKWDADLDQVRRYAAPVQDERDYMATRAREIPVTGDEGAPSLEELSVNRLATRSVRPQDLTWDAVRRDGEWTLLLSFEVAGRLHLASWAVDLPGQSLEPLDDEAKWLSETRESTGPIPHRHLSAVGDSVFDIDTLEGTTAYDLADGSEEDEADPTLELLDQLNSSRGVRIQLDLEEELFASGAPPAAHPPYSDPAAAVDAQILELPPIPEDDGEDPEPPDSTPTPPRGSGRPRRAKMPTWDEIVFGARSD